MRVEEAKINYNKAILNEQLININRETEIELSKLGNSNITNEAELIGNQLDKVYCAIKKAAMAKQDELIYNELVLSEVINILKKDGFNFNIINNQYIISGWAKEVIEDDIVDKFKKLKVSHFDKEAGSQIKFINKKIEDTYSDINKYKDLSKEQIRKEISSKYRYYDPKDSEINRITDLLEQIHSNNRLIILDKDYTDSLIKETINYFKSKNIKVKYSKYKKEGYTYIYIYDSYLEIAINLDKKKHIHLNKKVIIYSIYSTITIICLYILSYIMKWVFN